MKYDKTGFNSCMKSDSDVELVPYDQRSGCYVNRGNVSGVGKRQPVGHMGNPKMEGVPMGRVDTMKLYPHEKSE